MQENYVDRILKAKVYDVAIETALEAAPRLSRRLDNRIWFKREDLQPVFSFKIRGAYNKIAQLSAISAQRGVICASAGNHAQGVALAAKTRGIPAVIVMPLTTPEIKVRAVADLGGDFAYAAMPAISPPPPTGTKMASISSPWRWRRTRRFSLPMR